MLSISVLHQIKASLGRYLAIFSIIALGVGFFAGLRVSTESMLKTADVYLTEKDFYDFRLLSTLGLTEEDVAAFDALENVKKAEGSVSADLLYETQDGSDAVLRAHTLSENINIPDLQAGRLPERYDECVLDATFSDASLIGTKIVLSDENDEDTFDTFTYDAYTVVGLVNSPYYVNFERGTTKLGQGKAAGFMYIPAGGFSAEYFTEIFLAIPKAGEIYTDAYDDSADAMRDTLESLLTERADLRYKTLRDEAEKEIADAEEELAEGWETYRRERADAEAKLSDAWEQLTAAQKELTRGRKEYEDGVSTLENSKSETERQLAEAQKSLYEARQQIEASEAQLADLKTLYSAGESLTQGLNAALGTSFTGPGALVAALLAGNDPYLTAAADQALLSFGTTVAEFAASWAAAEETLGAPLTAETLTALQSRIEEARAQYDAGVAELEKNKTAAEAQLAEAQKELDAAERKLRDGEETFEKSLAEYHEARADADEQFVETEKKLNEAQADIDEARTKLDDELKAPTTYVLDRSTNIGYASLNNDMSIVSGISKVFPLFFFLVAALVCVTTMTRMVDEQRTHNGVLKALGYGDGSVVGQYLFYAGSASALGCIAGFLIGSRYMPMALWKVYQIMYSIKRPVAFVLNWRLFTGCTALYLVCALGATWLVCRRELRDVPAELIRPKSPPAGKRILLERVTFLWKRVKFLHKVSIRNILRYKKRLVMMVLGIGGCTALLLTGFGIRDSIKPIVDYQYEEIDIYDASVTFRKAPEEEERAEFLAIGGDMIKDAVFLYTGSMDVTAGGKTQSVNIVVSDMPLDDFIDLHKGETALAWPGKGEAVIDYRLAHDCGLSVGDSITLSDSDLNTLTVTVTGIFDNYIYDYVYLSADTFADQLGRVPEYKTAYVNFAESTDKHAAAAVLLGSDDAVSVNINDDMRTRVGHMLESMDYVVLIVLVCAGALAFIVLYNLTNISITERLREIATLKVLGFYSNEVAAYVFRENLVLTGISALFGLPMGIALLRYVMSQIKINSMYFGCRLAPSSYLWSIVLTFAFAFVVDFFLSFKLERINMSESLKAIE